jgi:epoxyqueuosine reductase
MCKRPILSPPNGETQILLHSCCAPCSGDIIETLQAAGLDLTVFFYNPNIHPRKEYDIRKEENKRFAEQLKVPFVDADYDMENWFSRTKGLEFDPERGQRCAICFDIRFERTALYAHEHGFKVFTSTTGISRWKNMEQVNECGSRAAARYPDLTYWTYNWRKQGGSQRMTEIAKREQFYQQEYCGCAHSLREINQRRKQQGREMVKIGVKYYGESGK